MKKRKREYLYYNWIALYNGGTLKSLNVSELDKYLLEKPRGGHTFEYMYFGGDRDLHILS